MNNQNNIKNKKEINVNKIKIEPCYQIQISNYCLGLNSILFLVTNMYILV
jgi:hypothetical protein